MCRLAALSFNPAVVNLTQRLLFNNLLWISHTEGNTHGAGYCAVNGTNNYAKTGESAMGHVFGEKFMAFMNQHADEKVSGLLGHTRMASPVWREDKQTAFPKWQAHPFEIGNGALLFHNGIFSEHARIAEEYGLVKDTYTDTTAFLEILKETTDGGKTINYATIQAALEKAGSCEYALLVVDGSGNIFAVRGIRPLHFCETTHGILVNTNENNIRNAIVRTNHVCTMLGWECVKFEEIPMFREWTIHTIKDGEFLGFTDLEGLEEINQPKRLVTASYSKHYHRKAGTVANGTLDLGTVVSKTSAYLAICDLQPLSLTDANISLMLYLMIGGKESGGWWSYDLEDLLEIPEILKFFWKEHPKYVPSEEKELLWSEVVFGCMDIRKDPYVAAKGVVLEFVFPYFHNTLEELTTVHKVLGKPADA